MSVVAPDLVARYMQIDASDAGTELLTLTSDAAQGRLEKYCNRAFESATHTDEYHDIENLTTNRIFLHNPPVTTLTTLTNDAQATDGGSTIAAADYTLDGNTGILTYDSGTFAMGHQSVKVTYVGGYTAALMPDKIKLAILQMTGILWEPDRPGRLSERIEGQQVEWDTAEIPLAIAGLIAPYRRMIA